MTRAGVARVRATRNRARRRTAGAVVVTLVAAGLGYAAVASDGSTVHEADLNDAGVWVSSAVQAKFARANVPIGQLDTGVATEASSGTGPGRAPGRCGRARAELGDRRAVPARRPHVDRRRARGHASARSRRPTGGSRPGRSTCAAGRWPCSTRRAGRCSRSGSTRRRAPTSFPGVAVGAKPVATVGRNAALAVGVDGVIHAVSGADGTGHDGGPRGRRVRRPGRLGERPALDAPGPHGRRARAGWPTTPRPTGCSRPTGPTARTPR